MGKKNIDPPILIKISSILRRSFSVNVPHDMVLPINNHAFNYTVESGVDVESKTVLLTVTIMILTGDFKTPLGHMTVQFGYALENFENAVIVTEEETLLNNDTFRFLSSISISTLRGIAFTTFQGTILFNAIIPLIDVSNLMPTTIPKEEREPK